MNFPRLSVTVKRTFTRSTSTEMVGSSRFCGNRSWDAEAVEQIMSALMVEFNSSRIICNRSSNSCTSPSHFAKALFTKLTVVHPVTIRLVNNLLFFRSTHTSSWMFQSDLRTPYSVSTFAPASWTRHVGETARSDRARMFRSPAGVCNHKQNCDFRSPPEE
jgi:hypothetical protein